MATSDKPRQVEAVPLDLLPVIRKSGVLNARQFEEIRAKVLSGEYPNDSRALADRLVRESILTEYQTNRFLNNKSHGLVVGGRYVVLDRLGSGSMGRVYKAHHTLMGRQVAIKIIAPEIVSNQRVVARFQREMKLVGRLDHPNVVRAFDADQAGDVLFIIMEYVPGQSLAHRLRDKGVLSPIEVVNYAAQAALGLAHAHSQGMVHRDIKPSNLLLGEGRQIKILDLGLGVLMEADNQATFETADGIAVGTIDFMSPEQASGKDVDGRSDLYSLGCSMYYLMTGQYAFPGDSPIERLGKRIRELPIPISEHLPNLPSRLVRIMDILMAQRPRERFQSADEAAEALQSLTRKKNPPRSEPAETPQAPPPASEPIPTPTGPTVESPEYPVWFRPLVRLAEDSPAALASIILATAFVLVTAGLALGWAIF